MQEIEVKILEVNPDLLIPKIVALGAEFKSEDVLEAYYYDFEDNRLWGEKKIFRIRKKGEKVILTFKQMIDNSQAKIMTEYEAEVSELASMQKIAEGLGLKVIRTEQKKRISYQKENIHFDIDIHHAIPPLLEIEAPNIESLHYYAKALGYAPTDMKAWSSVEVLAHYGLKAF